MTRPTHGDFGDFPARLALEDAASSCLPGSQGQPSLTSPRSPRAAGARLPPEGAAVSAAEALKVARSFGIRLVVDGDDLVLKGSAPPQEVEHGGRRRGGSIQR
jgi:hypothetical protein